MLNPFVRNDTDACSGRGSTLWIPRAPWTVLLAIGALVGCAAPGPQAGSSIDEAGWVTLTGNMHPAANAFYDAGPVDDDLPLEHLQLVLQRSPEQEAALQALMEAQLDPSSPLYHRWLTAEEFGAAYGVTDANVAAATTFLTGHRFRIDSVPVSRMFIEFSGTAGLVREAFHTSIHNLDVRGERHIANMSEPQVPEALSKIVLGIHALNDFMPHPASHTLGGTKRDKATGKWSLTEPGAVTPADTFVSGGTFYAVAPADYATIYNANAAYTAGYLGAGQTIAVIEDTLLKTPGDVTTFRSAFLSPSYTGTFSQVLATGTTTCTAPTVNSAEGEAALDAEWAGAAAPNAAVKLAYCADTASVFGGLIAIQNLINGASPPQIISLSYLNCESALGTSGYATWLSTWQQAAAEGISVFVAAGDGGGAGCDDFSTATFAADGLAVNGFASTPYNLAAGGTDFEDTYNAGEGGRAVSTYWSTSTSTSGNFYLSAKSYMPEVPWNDSCAGKLLYTYEGKTQGYGTTGYCNNGGSSFVNITAGSGGASIYQSQPLWQRGVVGLPTASGGARYLPDVSMFAANGLWNHFFLYCMTDTAQGGGPCVYSSGADSAALAGGGTSYVAPILAGIQALIDAKNGSPQGNPAPQYYSLAAAEYGVSGSAGCNSNAGAPASAVAPSSSCIFYDVTQGDTDVPCEGSTNCYLPSGTYGALSTSNASFGDAWAAGTGWDYATGIGTVNVFNLVTNFGSGLVAAASAGAPPGNNNPEPK